MHDVPGIERIRFATSHPRYFTDRLVRACAELPKLCEFFHIPFQSGDDDILREMKRGYTGARYKAIIDNIRRYMPDASISGDAIVGFPGESEEQYLATEALVREVGFDRVNTAAYSPRPNTPAAEWENQVSGRAAGRAGGQCGEEGGRGACHVRCREAQTLNSRGLCCVD